MVVIDEKRVLTYGHFDLFNDGHVQFLRRLSGLGRTLVVGLTTDALSASRGHHCAMSFQHRRDVLEACRYVDRVIPEVDYAQKRTDIVNYNISVLALPDKFAGEFDNLNTLAQVLYVPFPVAEQHIPLRQNIVNLAS